VQVCKFGPGWGSPNSSQKHFLWSKLHAISILVALETMGVWWLGVTDLVSALGSSESAWLRIPVIQDQLSF